MKKVNYLTKPLLFPQETTLSFLCLTQPLLFHPRDGTICHVASAFLHKRLYSLLLCLTSTQETVLLPLPDAASALLHKVRRLQAVVRGGRDRQLYQTRLRDSAYRERVVFEVLSTEHTYVDSLVACVEVYLRPLEAANAAGKPILEAEKVEVGLFLLSFFFFFPLFFFFFCEGLSNGARSPAR